MKKIVLSALLIMISLIGFSQTDPNMGIIPVPASITRHTGTFVLDKAVVLISNEAQNTEIKVLLKDFVKSKSGFLLQEQKQARPNQKTIILTSVGADKFPNEGYQIKVTEKQIMLIGKGAGLFYALQSLMQMVPDGKNNKIELSIAEVTDYPRFKYRGLHLDVGRHMFPVSFVKRLLDVMAQYKLNNFHWHLTEDQGWRIEIKRYPKLTSVGGGRNGTIVGRFPGIATDNDEHKGYYSQDEVKDVVAYAATKYINVIPEIEMPGHSSAAIAAYPELSCFPDHDSFIDVKTPWAGNRKGKQVQQTWGIFPDVYVPSEYTFKFLENVLDEVIALFPSKYIHIGGDECPKDYWKQSEFCQQLIKQLGLKDEHELQSYFIQRIEKYINAKGRSIIGWDEILEGGLAPNATVMSWRGTQGGIAAAKLKHDVIMTPSTSGLYLDYNQSYSDDEPLTAGGFAPYSMLYRYDPMPTDLSSEEQKHIVGVQANIWTEYMESREKVEYMILPRLFALSEVAWSKPERKDFKNFSEERLAVHLARLDKTNTNYWVPTPFGQEQKILKGASFNIALKAPFAGAQIYYTLDQTRPALDSRRYLSPIKFTVPKGEKRSLKTIVITPGGKRSVVTETILSNDDDEK